MKENSGSNLGQYIPSFFCMSLNVKEIGPYMSKKELSIFVHEYVHYLQNITSIYGISTLLSDFCVLINIINWLKINKNGQISIPVNLSVLSSLTKNNDRISKLTWGDTDTVYKTVRILDLSIDYDNPISIDEYRKIETVYLTIRTENDVDEIVSFSAREVSESMAYLMEQFITEDFESSPEYPYSMAIKVTEYIYPILSNDLRNVFVICDKALMSSNPGVEFVEILNWLKSISFVPSSPDELFILLDENWTTYDLDKPVDRIENFKKLVEEVRHNMHLILQDDVFADYHIWLDKILDYAIDLRTTEPMFWLDIIDNGYIDKNFYFQSVMHLAGAPLMESVKKEYFYVDPYGVDDSSSLVYFKVFNHIFQILLHGNVTCTLMPWCNNKRNSVDVDRTCFVCPWDHPIKNNEFCTFRSIWHHWGLDSIKINVNCQL